MEYEAAKTSKRRSTRGGGRGEEEEEEIYIIAVASHSQAGGYSWLVLWVVMASVFFRERGWRGKGVREGGR